MHDHSALSVRAGSQDFARRDRRIATDAKLRKLHAGMRGGQSECASHRTSTRHAASVMNETVVLSRREGEC